MTVNDIKQIIHRNHNDIAFVIGNGINRYPNNPKELSWDGILMDLWNTVSFQTLSIRPEGISTTEFYDILDLENTRGFNLQQKVTELMDKFDVVNPDWEWVHFCDLETIANRSNCVMSTDKLENEYGFKMWEEKVALESALTNIINI